MPVLRHDFWNWSNPAPHRLQCLPTMISKPNVLINLKQGLRRFSLKTVLRSHYDSLLCASQVSIVVCTKSARDFSQSSASKDKFRSNGWRRKKILGCRWYQKWQLNFKKNTVESRRRMEIRPLIVRLLWKKYASQVSELHSEPARFSTF